MSRAIFITATGTDVGKTYVSALILKTLRENDINAGYYKSALSGAENINGKLIAGDAKYICNISGIEKDPSSLVSFVYEKAVSPHLASKTEGNPVEISTILSDFEKIKSQFDYVLVEGSGGIICPLRLDNDKQIMLTDVIKKLDLDIIIIAESTLGTINSTVLTVKYAESLGINIRGIILNNFDKTDTMHCDNKKQIEFLTEIPIITCVKINDKNLNIDTNSLVSLFKEV